MHNNGWRLERALALENMKRGVLVGMMTCMRPVLRPSSQLRAFSRVTVKVVSWMGF